MDDQQIPSLLSENNNENNQNNDGLLLSNNNDKVKDSPSNSTAVKKRRGAVQLIKVALYMIRRRSGKSKSTVDVASSGGSLWNCLVGSMRPLHLQSHGTPRHHHAATHDHKNNAVITSPMSPGASSSYSTDDDTSRYASAANLQALDTESRYASAENLRALDDSECEDDHGHDENGGDEMIDAKAEEFIAQFYQQIRLQRLNSMDRRYNEMIQRSIG
ncbi:hypothetical protein CsatB_005950 [Cannabis sativa]|uniref:Cotton fiber protein n=2 Tax=Cannabis sativa TaxID=3483 RepID=A0AB40EAM7_CANSA|nr:uncharacterized protein LOC115702541 [Cannabis sativa]KAF4381986.1 hypothetical protein G4B88_006618 [Cannabis sativa]